MTTEQVQASGLAFPKTLDLDEWLIFSLDKGDEGNRLLVLEELRVRTLSDEFAARLQTVSAKDPAPACRRAAVEILAARQAAEKGRKLAVQAQLTPDMYQALAEQADPAFREALLRSIRKAPSPEILDMWRAQLLGAPSPEVTEVALTLLARFGRPEDAGCAAVYLASDNPEHVKAAIDLLHAHNIDSFKEQIALPLASSHMGIKMHAIRRLRSVDAAEAMIYLRMLLSDSDPLIRQKALRELLLVPFHEAETAYLQFLSTETRPTLLVAAGLAVAFNPDPELPLKIYDIFLVSRGAKQQILQLVLNELVDSIRQAGILKESPQEYVARLKERLQKRRQVLLIQHTIKELANPDASMRQAAVQRLRPYAGDPVVSEALRRRLPEEPDEDIKAILVACTAQAEQQAVQHLVVAVTSGDFYDLPLPQQRSLVNSVHDQAGYATARASLKVLLLGNLHRSVLLETVVRIGSFGQAGDVTVLLPLLQHAEPGVVAAAVKACGQLDVDALLPTLNKLLQHDDPRVKAAALEVFVLADKEGAVQYLSSMVRATSPTTRRQALTLMPLLDYPSAEPILTYLFLSEPVEEIKLQAGYMLAANPTRDGIKTLYRGTHADQGKIKRGWQELWDAGIATAEQTLGLKREEIEAQCVTQLDAEKKAQEAPAPKYAFQKVVGTKAGVGMPASLLGVEPELTTEQKIEKLKSQLWEMRMQVLIALVILSPLAWFFVFGTSGTPGVKTDLLDRKPRRTYSGSGPAAPMQQMTVQGLQSNVDQVLGGDSYAGFMQSVDDELEEIDRQIEKSRRERIEKILEDRQATFWQRMAAAAALDERLQQAEQALTENRLSDAEDIFLKILADPEARPYVKAWAYQGLMQLALSGRGTMADFARYSDGYFALLNADKPPAADGTKVQNVSEKLLKLDEIGRQFQNQDFLKHLRSALQKGEKLSEPEADQRVTQMMEGMKSLPSMKDTGEHD
ncbi:MAG TPA: HEAT repeat domain-containing protein [Candidatus Ozemobacteraceae bacterium]|nr:HEAT repeat domain-containing protein [Candidatus Ozemobacteraceae bacterium]